MLVASDPLINQGLPSSARHRHRSEPEIPLLSLGTVDIFWSSTSFPVCSLVVFAPLAVRRAA